MKYKGKYVDFQRVRAKKSPKIEMVGESPSTGEKEEAGAAESVQKEAFMQPAANGPIAPEWELLVESPDGELVDFDGFNLNYAECRAVVLVFSMPILVTGTPR